MTNRHDHDSELQTAEGLRLSPLLALERSK